MAKGQIPEWFATRKQSEPNFSKNEHFLPPGTRTCLCVSGGKKCSCFEKFDTLCFLVTPVEICLFALFPTYCRVCYTTIKNEPNFAMARTSCIP